NPTVRSSAARSPHSPRTAAPFSAPGLIVATRKIAALVSGAATGCGTADKSAAVIGSESIGISRRGGRRLIRRNRPRRLTHLGEQSEACFVLRDVPSGLLRMSGSGRPYLLSSP